MKNKNKLNNQLGQVFTEYIIYTSAISILFYFLFYSLDPLIKNSQDKRSFQEVIEDSFIDAQEHILHSLPQFLNAFDE
ncbi:MAG: hypothetical protein K2X39_08220 [Silvanigrellaceae bacterium]|nr:hypothetical protein [Silvanigrellaceae bacterium]